MRDEFGFSMYPADAFQTRGRGQGMRLHGGKGNTSSAPPPDPRLVEAQIRSMGFQDQAIQKMLANSERLAPLQEQELRSGIERGTQLYTQGQEDRSYALERRGVLTGLQDKMSAEAAEFNTEGKREQLADQAQADVTTSFGNARSMEARNLERAGVNPGSGKAIATSNASSLTEAAAGANAANKTRALARTEGYQLTDRAANTLAGFPALTASSIGTGAGVAGLGLGAANAGAAGINQGVTSAATAAGQLGANATGMYGAQASYKTAQDKLASEQSDPFGAILGKGLGAFATSYGAKLAVSDRRLKTNVKLVGQLPNGVNIYTYQYITGGPFQMGVMADELVKVIPEAVTHRAISDEFDAVDYSKIGEAA